MIANWHDCNQCGLSIGHDFFPAPDANTVRVPLALALLELVEDDGVADDVSADSVTTQHTINRQSAIADYRKHIMLLARERIGEEHIT